MKPSEVVSVVRPIMERRAPVPHVPGNRLRQLAEKSLAFISHGAGCGGAPGSCTCGAATLHAAIKLELALR